MCVLLEKQVSAASCVRHLALRAGGVQLAAQHDAVHHCAEHKHASQHELQRSEACRIAIQHGDQRVGAGARRASARMLGGWSPLETKVVEVEVEGMRGGAEAGRPCTVLLPSCYRRRLQALEQALEQA